MQLKFKYGKDYIITDIKDENVAGVLLPKELPGNDNPLQVVVDAMNSPIGTPTLSQLAVNKKPERVVIVVNDATRPTPYRHMLPPVLDELHRAGVEREKITLVIATGAHRPNTEEESRLTFSDRVVNNYRLVNHNCDEDLTSLGKLSDGSELLVNAEVAAADLLITTGIIIPHYIAGFSGGRKSILPGVAARPLITANHARMTDPRVDTARWLDNPVHKIMTEAAKKVGVDFILNVVTNENNQIVAAVAGDLEKAWEAGVQKCSDLNLVPVEEPVEVVIAGAGGYPKDLNLYQAQKPMDSAARVTRAGGTIILVAECSEGYGNSTFTKWMTEAQSLEDIYERFRQGFVLGGHKAYAYAQVLKDKEVVLVSAMSKEDVENMFMTYCSSLEDALAYVERKHGPGYKALVMPQAGLVLPQLR
ncbi:nickel-dependent lactate racemase [Desulfolucanica intricata]|uniref:nickel-dependent lactate racemase n=1 Tax=Desulfolucanica intricata TaxID=1285191 RepID=UPI00082A0A3E|nr:nickel-dependent lactate racemase [Desulfolucanica intricata]